MKLIVKFMHYDEVLAVLQTHSVEILTDRGIDFTSVPDVEIPEGTTSIEIELPKEQ